MSALVFEVFQVLGDGRRNPDVAPIQGNLPMRASFIRSLSAASFFQ